MLNGQDTCARQKRERMCQPSVSPAQPSAVGFSRHDGNARPSHLASEMNSQRAAWLSDAERYCHTAAHALGHGHNYLGHNYE